MNSDSKLEEFPEQPGVRDRRGDGIEEVSVCDRRSWNSEWPERMGRLKGCERVMRGGVAGQGRVPGEIHKELRSAA